MPKETSTPAHTKIKVERVQTGVRIEKRMLKDGFSVIGKMQSVMRKEIEEA